MEALFEQQQQINRFWVIYFNILPATCKAFFSLQLGKLNILKSVGGFLIKWYKTRIQTEPEWILSWQLHLEVKTRTELILTHVSTLGSMDGLTVWKPTGTEAGPDLWWCISCRTSWRCSSPRRWVQEGRCGGSGTAPRRRTWRRRPALTQTSCWRKFFFYQNPPEQMFVTYLLPHQLLGRTPGWVLWRRRDVLERSSAPQRRAQELTDESPWMLSVGTASGRSVTLSPLRSKQSSLKWDEQMEDQRRGCQWTRPTAIIHWARTGRLDRGNLQEAET